MSRSSYDASDDFSTTRCPECGALIQYELGCAIDCPKCDWTDTPPEEEEDDVEADD